MNKIIFTFPFVLISIISFSQNLDQLFNSDEFVWCGLDYSNVRCIGPDFNDPVAIKNRYFDAWNQLMLDEASKFNFKEPYKKTKQINDLSVVERRNKMVDIEVFIIDTPYQFEEGQLKAIIADYELKSVKQGLGLVYVIESLNKNNQEAVIHTVFFDIATKEIIWARKFTAPAGGFGFRNYWARPIYEVIKESGWVYKKSYKKYRKSLKKK